MHNLPHGCWCCANNLLSHALLQLDKMDASARSKAEMAQKIAQELLKSSGHRMGMTSQHMPALNSEQSNIVRAAQQKAAEIAIQASPLHPPVCIAPLWSFLQPDSKLCCKSSERKEKTVPLGANLMRSHVLYWVAQDASPVTLCRQLWPHRAALLSDVCDVFAGLWSGCSWHSMTQHVCCAHGNFNICSVKCLVACDDLSWQSVCLVVPDCTCQPCFTSSHPVLHVRMTTGCSAHLGE